ncbi:MAG: archease [bacterium]
MNELRYQLLEHTADLRVAIYGKDIIELFRNAAFMLFDVMVDLNRVEKVLTEEVNLTASEMEELFLDWLRELLFFFSARGFVTKAVAIEQLDPEASCLKAKLLGENYQTEKHGLKIEIKTPTYHQYRLERTATGWMAVVVFDV